MFREVLVPVVLLIVLIVALVVAARAVKRRAIGGDRSDAPGWTAADLRWMRDSGQLTAEQYERLRDRLVRNVRAPDTVEHDRG